MAVLKNRRRTPFNLPPAWSPGMALPENVVNEGLERRALVTMQVPDGTFDNPAVGTGGYVVPDYILKERYGRGTYVTAWQQRGTYNGPGIPNFLNYPVSDVVDVKEGPNNTASYVLDSLHGYDGETVPAAASMAMGKLPGPYEAYAQHVASVVMRHVQSHPPAQRKQALKKVMDRIDPSLYKRTAVIARHYEKRGMPARQALHQGLARAMGTGFIAEIVRTGRSRSKPLNRGQLGLGCYGSARSEGLSDLGGLLDDVKSSTGKLVTAIATAAAAATKSGPTCANPPQGFTWVPATQTIPGHWERLRVGQTVGVPNPALPPNPAGCSGGGTVRTHEDDPSNALKPLTAGTPDPNAKMMQVGPFKIPAAPGKFIIGPTIRDHTTAHTSTVWGQMPIAWQQKIGQAIVKQWQNMYAMGGVFPNIVPAVVPASDLGIRTPPMLGTVTGGMSAADIKSKITDRMIQGIAMGGSIGNATLPLLKQPNWVPLYLFPTKTHQSSLEAVGGGIPLFRATHPVTGEQYGLWLLQQPEIDGGGASNVSGDKSLRKDADGTLHIAGPIRFLWQRIDHPDSSVWDDIGNFFEDIGATIIDGVKDVVNAVGDAACAALSSALAPAGAAAGAAALGVPPQAGAAGVQLAQGACGSKPPAVAPMAPSSSLLVPLAIGGAALVAVILLTGPKAKKATK